MRRLYRLDRALLPVVTLIALIVLWEVLVAIDATPIGRRVIPAPSEVVDAMIRTQESLLTRHIPQTMAETLIGLAIALVLGVGLAALLDFSALLKRAVYPLLVISQTIPIVAIAPVLILIFGFGIEPKVVVVVLFCFFPIAVATIDGLTATDPDLVALLRAMGASRGQVWRKVRLPAALPSLFSGLRIAATYSVTGAIFGEYITSQYGLGQYLRSAFSTGRTDQAFVPIIITAVLSIGLVAVVAVVERVMLPWFYTEARESHWQEPGIY
ncbi:MAG: ABC transporter permease [Anaerolineae bacterium]|nr:ABC transporter permease [Anaerolineae bacterium]